MRAGVNARTGEILTGWDHCVQSIGKCLSTRLATRALRRHLGSDVPRLQDANADALTIFDLYRTVAEALNDPDGGEPGFSLQTIEMVEVGRSGRFVFLLVGVWYPRGHLGDWSIRETVTTSWPEVA
jgi:phage baseplate assembly protein W